MMKQQWSRDELIVAFNLYCKLPFGRIHRGNPEIIDLARAIGRTPSAVAWKLANFARLDPALQKRNVKGASHGSRADVAIWNEFNGDWDKLAFESERLVEQMTGHSAILEKALRFPEGKTREVLVRARVNQAVFRSMVVASYDSRCCITGLQIPELLRASHIVPWSVDLKNRTNPANGLCLNALHDRAFDVGLITITPNLKIKVSSRPRCRPTDATAKEFIRGYDGAVIRPPSRFLPEAEFLRYHNERIFLGD
jgi:putative restriction endonuclease